MDHLIFSVMRMRKRHLFCTSSHHNVPYEKQQELSDSDSACAIAKYALHWYTHERTTRRKYLEDCSIYIEIGTFYGSS